jgi:hypothetical protein
MQKILIGLLGLVILILGALAWFLKSDSTNPYETVTWGKFSAECAAEELPGKKHGNGFVGCDYDVPEEEIPTFKEVGLPFSNAFDNTKSLPLMASAMIDIDQDGVDEVFLSGGITQGDALFKYTADGFTDISDQLPAKPANTTTYGATSFDLDADGDNDLILTGDYGVHWLKNTDGTFEATPIAVTLNDKSVAATTTIADYDGDGHADIFLCAYIKLDKMEGQTIFKDKNYGSSSVLLHNNGDGTFSDVTEAAGLSYVHNTFQAVFVNLDEDSDLDLVVAYDTGEARTYKNGGDGTFSVGENPLTGRYAYPMGIAVGDYNNDGRTDLFFSNTGSSVPTFLARGDLAEEDVFVSDWILFKNEGNFKFSDAADEAMVADFEFSWGAVFADFNLDGRQDLAVAENYVDFPPHQLFKLPCRFLLQRPGGVFAAVEDQAGVVNKNYGITPLVSDFNQDGYPDMVYVNINGGSRAFINKGGDHNYIGFRFPETAEYSGAKVTVKLKDGSIRSDDYVVGEGLASDQTSVITVGLGKEESVEEVSVSLPNGGTMNISKPEVNMVHLLTVEH